RAGDHRVTLRPRIALGRVLNVATAARAPRAGLACGTADVQVARRTTEVAHRSRRDRTDHLALVLPHILLLHNQIGRLATRVQIRSLFHFVGEEFPHTAEDAVRQARIASFEATRRYCLTGRAHADSFDVHEQHAVAAIAVCVEVALRSGALRRQGVARNLV